MTILPLDQAIPRFQANDDRFDTFVNGDESTNMTTSGGTAVPSVRRVVQSMNNTVTQFLAGKDTEINTSATSILAQSVAARDKARSWADAAVDAPVESGAFSAKHHATKAAASATAAAAFADVFTPSKAGLVPAGGNDPKAVLYADGSFKKITVGESTILDSGFVGDGATDNSAKFAALTEGEVYVVPKGVYRISANVTIKAILEFRGGGRLQAVNAAVTLTRVVMADPEAWVFEKTGTGSFKYGNGTVYLAWHGHRSGDGSDIGPTVNSMITGAPVNGRQLMVPPGEYLVATTIVFADMPGMFGVTGANMGQRSNVEYQAAAPRGLGLRVDYPGGGSKFYISPTLENMFLIQEAATAQARQSGITVQGMNLVGLSNPASGVTQYAFRSPGHTDKVALKNNNIYNWNGCAVAATQCDAWEITGNWILENSRSLDISYFIASDISNNIFSAHDPFVACTFSRGYHSVISNNRFIQGCIATIFSYCEAILVTGNQYVGLYTQIAHYEYCKDCEFSDSYMRNPTGIGTDWVGIKSGVWPAPNYDPLNRPPSTGIMTIVNCTACTWRDWKITSYAPAGWTGIKISGPGTLNELTDFSWSGNPSNNKLVHSDSTGTVIKNVCNPAEASLPSGSFTITWKDTSFLNGVNGFRRDASGQVEQWGTHTAAADSRVTFPVAFPGAPWNVQLTMIAANTAANISWSAHYSGVDVNGFDIHKRFNNAGALGAATEACAWRAVGPGY